MGRLWFATAAALITTPLMGLPASASTCATGSVAAYTAVGFSCNVGSVTFSNIAVSTTFTGSGSVALGNFTPFSSIVNGALESGLSLNYTANTGTTANSAADVAWTYNVSASPGSLLSDAFLSFAGNVTGTGTAVVNEILSNNVSLSLNSPGSISQTFAAIASLGVIKDQNDFSGSAGSASTSILQNGFSVTPTPIPGTLPLLGTGLAALWALRRKRKARAIS